MTSRHSLTALLAVSRPFLTLDGPLVSCGDPCGKEAWPLGALPLSIDGMGDGDRDLEDLELRPSP